MIQGGDITNLDGTGPSPSIFGGHFKDETFKIKFNRPYLLAMANNGQPNTNGSQWFITTAPATHLNGSHVAFGEVFDSQSKHVIKEVEKLGSQSGQLKDGGHVVIKNCGMVDPLLSNQLQKIHLQHGMCDVMVSDLYRRILQEKLGDDEPLYEQDITPASTRARGEQLVHSQVGQHHAVSQQDAAFRNSMHQRAKERQERQRALRQQRQQEQNNVTDVDD